MKKGDKLELLYLMHPGSGEIHSGFGLPLTETRLVGLLYLDIKEKSNKELLKKLLQAFHELRIAYNSKGELEGVECQMEIAPESLLYVTPLPHYPTVYASLLLLSHLHFPPRVTFLVEWKGYQWNITIMEEGRELRFPSPLLAFSKS